MELKNYPSGDEEFDNWFRATQPDWAAEIDAKIAKDVTFSEMLETLEKIESVVYSDPRLLDLLGRGLFHEIKAIIKDAKKRS